jgi:hypothetical protein
MTNVIQYRDATDTTRGPSPIIWGDCPWMEIQAQVAQGSGGHAFFDDFLSSYDVAAGQDVFIGPYNVFTETGASLAGGTDTTGTVAEGLSVQTLIGGTTADANCNVQLGGGASFIVSDTAADAKKLWFEARFKISTIADSVSSFFIGLGQADRAAADAVFTTTQGATVDSAVADVALLGFWRPDADGDGLSTMYGAASQTAQEVLDDAFTLVADTYVKAGFVYDPAAIAANRIKFYFNGAESATYITGTNIEAATFPDAESMSPVVSIMNDDGSTASTLTLDWWRIAQLG